MFLLSFPFPYWLEFMWWWQLQKQPFCEMILGMDVMQHGASGEAYVSNTEKNHSILVSIWTLPWQWARHLSCLHCLLEVREVASITHSQIYSKLIKNTKWMDRSRLRYSSRCFSEVARNETPSLMYCAKLIFHNPSPAQPPATAVLSAASIRLTALTVPCLFLVLCLLP